MGDLRNIPRTSAPTAVISSTLQGDFGPCEFSIINITAFDPSNFDSSLDDGDAIMIYFTEPTDKGCGRNYLDASCGNGKYLNKTEVDNMLTFSNVVGANYSAVWINSMQLQINLLNVTGSTAKIGPLTITISDQARGDGLFPGLRNIPPNCGPRTLQSPRSGGNWGLVAPFIDDFRAIAGTNPTDSIYGPSDQISIHACAGGWGSRNEGGCAPTNRFNFKVGDVLQKSMITRMFEFSQDLGRDFIGRWEDSYKFTITVVNTSGCSPPEVHKLKVRVRHEGDCLCDNSLCTSYTCSSQGLFLRDQNNISFYSTSESMPIRGDWGPSSLSIESIYARPFSRDVPGIGVAFSMGDTITITFSKDTNYGRGPSECIEAYDLWPGQAYPPKLGPPCMDNGKKLSKLDLDGLFFFSQSLGLDYEGTWTSRNVLVISIKDVTGASPPGLLQFYIRVRREGNLRGFPAGSKCQKSQQYGAICQRMTRLLNPDKHPSRVSEHCAFSKPVSFRLSYPFRIHFSFFIQDMLNMFQLSGMAPSDPRVSRSHKFKPVTLVKMICSTTMETGSQLNLISLRIVLARTRHV